MAGREQTREEGGTEVWREDVSERAELTEKYDEMEHNAMVSTRGVPHHY